MPTMRWQNVKIFWQTPESSHHKNASIAIKNMFEKTRKIEHPGKEIESVSKKKKKKEI